MEKHKTVSECWKALAGCRESCCGLRSIPVAEYGGREIRAGIFFPEGAEALLTGFSEHIPLKLPQGYGFRVEALGGDVPDSSRHWLAIIRTFCGDTELFAIMAEDLKAVLEKGSSLFPLFSTEFRPGRPSWSRSTLPSCLNIQRQVFSESSSF